VFDPDLASAVPSFLGIASHQRSGIDARAAQGSKVRQDTKARPDDDGTESRICHGGFLSWVVF
jgi:hypothetical protein